MTSTTINTVQMFALADTYIATENVRAETVHDAEAIKLLAGSIRHFGRLLEPLKAYIDKDGKAAVWDGGRRHTALRMIEADGDGVGAVILENVAVFITTQDDASAASLATFVREDQHPADQFLAYNAKFDEGMSAEQIAAAFAVETKTVNQLLRFRTLSPEVLEAFRAGRFGLDVAYAFTLTTDHDKQRALLEATGDKGFDAWSIKRALTAGAVTARDQWARFIGREAYEEAGGTFVLDLFSQHQADEQWSNGDLVKELAQKKLDAMEAALLAEGWAKMIVPQYSYGWQEGYEAMKAEGPTKKGQPRAFTAEQMAQGVVFIVFQHGGDFEVKKGFRKVGKTASGPAIPKPDQELYGWGHKGHHVLTQVATDVTRYAIANNPQAAADALLATLAWSVLRKPQYGSAQNQVATNLNVDSRFNSRTEGAEIVGGDLLDGDIKEWSDRLPNQIVAFCEAVAALSMVDKMLLQAHCFAATIDGIETQIGLGDADRRRHLGWMARHAKAEPMGLWSPSEAFLKGGSKDALQFATLELAGSKSSESAKKGDLVKNVANLASAKPWMPKLLASFMDVKDAEPKVRTGLTANDDKDRDATSEAEYLGWLAEAFVNEHGENAVDANQMAALALEAEVSDGPEAFGDPNYGWTRSDASNSAQSYLDNQGDAASGDDA